MNLKRDKRQNIQEILDFSSEQTGEARHAGREETESRQTMHEPESPANTIRLMEEICERENLLEALRRVKGNKGSAGIDFHAPYRLRFVGPVQQLFPDGEPVRLQVATELADGHPVDPGATFVALHPP